MKKLFYSTIVLLCCGVFFVACENESVAPEDAVSPEILSKIQSLGFSTEGVIHFESGYLVENDIYLTENDLDRLTPGEAIPTVEQYSTNNLVTALPRTITVYISAPSSTNGRINAKPGNGNGGGKPGGGGDGGFDYSATYGDAVDEAISRFNAQNLTLTFQRTTNSSNADIVFTRLNKRDERRGVLGSAGFPTSSGDPYGEIKMSGVLESSYGLGVNGIATIMAHEMGHCIGFRHTDYFDRSISCGSGGNEGTAGVGANHIPGTPTGADLQGAGSWMLACTDGGNRPFTNGDKTALDYLY